MALSPEKQAVRNAQIVRDRADHNMSWAKIAKKHGITDRMCRKVYRRWMEEAGPTAPEDPLEVVDGLLRGFNADVWEATEAIDLAWDQKQPNSVISGVRTRMDARIKAIELLQATGRLPKDLGTLHVEHDVRFLIEQIVEVFDEHDVPVAVRRALMDRLRPAALNAGD
jgi:transposase-like protein